MNRSNSKPAVVCAADNNYAMCLAAMTASVLENCSCEEGLSLYVLDAGIAPENKAKLHKDWDKYNVDVQMISMDSARLANLPTSDHITIAAYFRILMGEVLPPDLSKIIYLDSDLVLEDDICKLWEIDIGDSYCLAVQDLAAPYIDSEIAMNNYARCWRNLAASRPIANYEQLSLDPRAAYFNSGVMSIDLDKWRKHSIKEQLLHCLEENRSHVLWWDQYALNVVFHGKWKPLNRRWNQTSHAFYYRNWQDSPLDEKNYEEATKNPGIIHFASPAKPWHYLCWAPRRQNFYKYLNKTAWAGFQPRLTKSDWNRVKRFYLPAKRNQFRQSFANIF